MSDILTHLWSDLFSFGWADALDKTIRTIAVYLGIALVIRVAGKRLMAQLNSLDLVVVLLLSNVVQNAIIGNDNSLTGGLLGALVLVGVNAVLDHMSRRSLPTRKVLEGTASTIVRDGEPVVPELRRLGVSPEDLDSELRRQGIDSIADVRSAQMMPGGALRVDVDPRAKSLTVGQFEDALAALEGRLDAISARVHEGTRAE